MDTEWARLVTSVAGQRNSDVCAPRAPKIRDNMLPADPPVRTTRIWKLALSPALSPSGVTHVPLWFDGLFGIGGAIGLAWAARRLWTHHRRDSRAAGFALLCWAALAAAVTARSALFAQADYERGRLPFFVIATLILLALGLVLHRSKRNDEL